MNQNAPRLLDQLRDRIRLKHYSIRTEQAYLDWVRRFVRFHGMRHPREMGEKEVEAFLTDLAVAGRVAASTQNQAKSAILFLYREVMGLELPWLSGVECAKRPQRLPVVLTREEVQAALAHVSGTSGLVLRLLYGTGMRILEALRLRVKDWTLPGARFWCVKAKALRTVSRCSLRVWSCRCVSTSCVCARCIAPISRKALESSTCPML